MAKQIDKYVKFDEDPTDDLVNSVVKPPKNEESIVSKVQEYIQHYMSKNNGKTIKLVILTPCYGGVTYVNYMICLINTIEYFRAISDAGIGKINVHVEFCKNDSLVTRARNNLIAKAMNIPDATHFMFIDNDITWNPIEIVKLLISDKEVVGGVYPLKNYKWENILKNGNISEKIAEKKRQTPMFQQFDDETILKSQLLKYNMNALSLEMKIENNISQIRHLPTGFMLIQKNAIEKMITSYPETKYNDDIGFLNTDENRYAFALFDTGLKDGHYLSEDWMFCERWINIGGSVYMDVSIMLSHTGTEDFTGCFILSV
jgi:hypothetical protein